jgi:hypothetical protein
MVEGFGGVGPLRAANVAGRRLAGSGKVLAGCMKLMQRAQVGSLFLASGVDGFRPIDNT